MSEAGERAMAAPSSAPRPHRAALITSTDLGILAAFAAVVLTMPTWLIWIAG
jgi:hypothetical protein